MAAISQSTLSIAFFNENVWILIKISLKFVAKGSINNIPALVQIMAWRGQATSHYLNQWWLVCWRIYASLGLNELINMLFAWVEEPERIINCTEAIIIYPPIYRSIYETRTVFSKRDRQTYWVAHSCHDIYCCCVITILFTKIVCLNYESTSFSKTVQCS